MRSIAFASFALAAWLFGAECGSAFAEVAVDHAAPSLVLTELNGDTFDLSQKHGKVVLVHYWATWCAPCKKEMPILDEYYKAHHAEGLEMIAVSADRARDRDEV